MITLNYAKKVGDAYILNFFADSEEDIEKFDITKEFMFYGVPSAGSLITCVSKDSSTNYYVDKSGSLVKIDQDQPTPSLIPFNGDGTQYIAGYEFDTSLSTDEIKSILSKLSYEIGEGDAGECMIVSCGETYALAVLKVISTNDYYIAAVDDGHVFAIYGTKAGTIGEIPFAGGFENLTDGKYHFSNADTLNVTFVNNDEGWNGILIGAVEGEPPQPTGLTPFDDSGSQYIIGIDFGNVVNGYTVENPTYDFDALDSFLAGLTYTYDTVATLVAENNAGYGLHAYNLSAATSGTAEGYMLVYIDSGTSQMGGGIVYSTTAFSDAGSGFSATQGFQNLTDGKYIGTDTMPVNIVNQAEGWNGTLIGAVEGEAPQPTGLTPFEVSDTISSFKVDTGMSAESISNIIQSVLTASGGESLVTVVKSHDEISDADYNLINFATNNGIYAISLLDGIPIYVSDIIPGLTETAGWQSSITIEDTTYNLINENGVLDFEQLLQEVGGSAVDIPLNITELDGEGWNGVIIGKVTE